MRQRPGLPAGNISIHALLAESDKRRKSWPALSQNFYPRSPCGERLSLDFPQHASGNISIHALLAESDYPAIWPGVFLDNFYPRSPCGERRLDDLAKPCLFISIHALLAESDAGRSSHAEGRKHFYPRSPCGERPYAHQAEALHSPFLSTLSLRRATLFS